MKNNTLNIGTRKLALTKEPVAPDLNCPYSIWQYPHPSLLWPGHNSMNVMCACECRSLLSVSSAISFELVKNGLALLSTCKKI